MEVSAIIGERETGTFGVRGGEDAGGGDGWGGFGWVQVGKMDRPGSFWASMNKRDGPGLVH